jgi:thiamine biosynthesis protein ThiI
MSKENTTGTIQYSIHYKEIALKRKLISMYERFLRQNISDALQNSFGKKIDFKLNFKNKIGLLRIATEYRHNIETVLNNTYGIAWWGEVEEYDIDVINDGLVQLVSQKLKQKNVKTVDVDVRRYNKEYPLTSQDVFISTANHLRELGIVVDRHARDKVQIVIKNNYVEIILKNQGLGGLPVGSSGRVLLLFSGGYDSIIAGYLLAKRGLAVDLIHFYPKGKYNKEKIEGLSEQLKIFVPRLRLYLYPACSEDGKKRIKYKTLMFRLKMLNIANLWASYKYGEKEYALGTGDNLAQVASQTLSNINALDYIYFKTNEAPKSILRPLLTYDKSEIIEISRKIHTYDLSTIKYEDCCTSISTSAHTKTKIERFLNEVENTTFPDIEEVKEKIVQITD